MRQEKTIEIVKKVNSLLNILIGAFIGVFTGKVIYLYWDFITHPDLQPVPWYTSILVSGTVTLAVILVAIIIKIIIKKYAIK